MINGRSVARLNDSKYHPPRRSGGPTATASRGLRDDGSRQPPTSQSESHADPDREAHHQSPCTAPLRPSPHRLPARAQPFHRAPHTQSLQHRPAVPRRRRCCASPAGPGRHPRCMRAAPRGVDGQGRACSVPTGASAGPATPRAKSRARDSGRDGADGLRSSRRSRTGPLRRGQKRGPVERVRAREIRVCDSGLVVSGEAFPRGLTAHPEGCADTVPGHAAAADLADPGAQVVVDLMADGLDAW